MDKIWYRNPSKSEVIGRCGEDDKTEWPRRTDKNRTKKKEEKERQSSNMDVFLYFVCIELAQLFVNFFGQFTNVSFKLYQCVCYFLWYFLFFVVLFITFYTI